MNESVVCDKCLKVGDREGRFFAGGGLVAHFGQPRWRTSEPDDGCAMCGSGGGTYRLVPVRMTSI